MPVKYKIYPERALLVDILADEIGLSDLKRLLFAETKHGQFQLVLKVLSDIRQANFTISLEEVQQYLDILKRMPVNTAFRWAILTKTPNQTALSMMIFGDPYFKKLVGVFSTLRACTDFLKTTFKEEEFHELDYQVVILPR